MEIRQSSVFFPAMRGAGPRTATQTIVFPRAVERAVVGLIGHSVGFESGDHHIGKLLIQTSAQINQNVVTATVTFGLRDWSGDWDDNYQGTIQFAVIAELSAPTTLGTVIRGDLMVTGIECSQVVQHFRSDRFLDQANVRPDNSIRLISRKTTGVRVYLDYDAHSGLPLIMALSGSLEVRTSTTPTVLTLNPMAAITPRRDSQIQRGLASHTLNFAIPEAWCQGELTVRCVLFDAANHAQRSAAFEETLIFQEVTPLRVHGVGVHYTGQGLDLPAPTQADVVATMAFTEKIYPVGEVELTGYMTIDFDRDMRADISNGCGSGFGALLSRLRDLRGSSDDIYYALLPAGVDTGNVGGCGGGGVGAAFTGSGATAAHEIGHAKGLQHAPCDDSGRCDTPANTNSEYPNYDGFASDSIGEYGYDPVLNRVFDPLGVYDMMGYSSPEWISPYTYAKLMAKFPPVSGLEAGSAGSAYSAMRMMIAANAKVPSQIPEWIRRPMPTLFLDLRISRDRKVERRPSFHFEALPGSTGFGKSGFTAEFADEEGNPLGCFPLRNPCQHCNPECWPKTFSERIPFPSGARALRIWEGKDLLYEERIPDPPKIELQGVYHTGKPGTVQVEEGFWELRWSPANSKEDVLWYLVQWEDGPGVWRGVAPRTSDRSIIIRPAAVGGHRVVRIRVLATSGIATGSAECNLTRESGSSSAPSREIVLPDLPDKGGPLPRILRGSIIDTLGRGHSGVHLAWFDDVGAEIGRGRTVDLDVLPEGEHAIRVVDLTGGAEAGQATFVVRREGNAFSFVTALKKVGRTPPRKREPKTGKETNKEW